MGGMFHLEPDLRHLQVTHTTILRNGKVAKQLFSFYHFLFSPHATVLFIYQDEQYFPATAAPCCLHTLLLIFFLQQNKGNAL